VDDADGIAVLVQVEPDKRSVNRQLDVKRFTPRDRRWALKCARVPPERIGAVFVDKRSQFFTKRRLLEQFDAAPQRVSSRRR
jgi:hypothetical protein